MEDTKAESINLLLYSLLCLLMVGVQTSIWPRYLSPLPAPMFWIYPLVFFALFHNFKWSMFYILICVFIMSSFSITPLELLFGSLILIYLGIANLKDRVFWRGLSYFLLCTFIASVGFHILYYVLSFVMEDTSISGSSRGKSASPQFFFSFFQIITTSLVGIIFYWINMQIEIHTRKFDTDDVEGIL
ncbi:MAG: hypothetical protein AB8E15_12995 [Bdellovibrionales bacterium]